LLIHAIWNLLAPLSVANPLVYPPLFYLLNPPLGRIFLPTRVVRTARYIQAPPRKEQLPESDLDSGVVVC